MTLPNDVWELLTCLVVFCSFLCVLCHLVISRIFICFEGLSFFLLGVEAFSLCVSLADVRCALLCLGSFKKTLFFGEGVALVFKGSSSTFLAA